MITDTALTSQLSAADGTVYLDDVRSVTVRSALVIDQEMMIVLTEPVEIAVELIDPDVDPQPGHVKVRRGVGGHQSPHAATATVYVAAQSDLRSYDPFGQPQAGDPDPWIVVATGAVWEAGDVEWVRTDARTTTATGGSTGTGSDTPIASGTDGNLVMYFDGGLVAAGESIESVVTNVLAAAGDVSSPDGAVVGNLAAFGDDLGESLTDSGLTYSTSLDTLIMPNLPIADPEVVGALWNDSGTLKVSAGEIP